MTTTTNTVKITFQLLLDGKWTIKQDAVTRNKESFLDSLNTISDSVFIYSVESVT